MVNITPYTHLCSISSTMLYSLQFFLYCCFNSHLYFPQKLVSVFHMSCLSLRQGIHPLSLICLSSLQKLVCDSCWAPSRQNLCLHLGSSELEAKAASRCCNCADADCIWGFGVCISSLALSGTWLFIGTEQKLRLIILENGEGKQLS